MSDEQPGGSSSFSHPLTRALHPDPDRFGERATVVGYPGPSPQTGRVRVYLDLTFTSYYELDAAAVLDTAPAKANDENSPTVVVIASSAPVDVVRVESGQTQARYLEGSITRGYLPSAAALSGAGGALGVQGAAFTVTVGGPGGNTLARQQADVTDGADCFCAGCSLVGSVFAVQQAARTGGAADCFCVATLVGTSGAPAGQ